MSKIKTGRCQDCKEQRKVEVEVLCSGLESVVWLSLSLFLHFGFLFVLVWRHWGIADKRCTSCGSKNVINVE